MWFNADVIPTEDLAEETLQSYLSGKGEVSKEIIVLDTLDNIDRKGLQTNVTVSEARLKIDNLLIDYRGPIWRNCLLWTLQDSQKIALLHVLRSIYRTNLQDVLQLDIDFAHHELALHFKIIIAVP